MLIKLSIFGGRSTHTHMFLHVFAVFETTQSWILQVVWRQNLRNLTAGGSSMMICEKLRRCISYHLIIYYLIGGLEHFLFSPIVGRMIQFD